MAIAVNTLMEEAKCYLCLGISQAEALQLALLNRITAGSGYPMFLPGGWEASTWGSLTTYYFGGDWYNSTRNGLSGASAYTNARVRIPKAGTITGYWVKTRIATPATAELVSIGLRINNLVTIGTTTQAWNAVTIENNVTGLSQAVAEGDFIALEVSTPTWGGAPTGARLEAIVWIS